VCTRSSRRPESARLLSGELDVLAGSILAGESRMPSPPAVSSMTDDTGLSHGNPNSDEGRTGANRSGVRGADSGVLRGVTGR
jgi:hypothetical protein